MAVTEFAPTAEQETALDLFATGGPLVIEAGAGTGKTSTLELLARSTDRTGCYVAFNNSIAGEAGRRMPATVDARTMHSFAYWALVDRLNIRERLDGAKVPPWTVATNLGLRSIAIDITDPSPRVKRLQPSELGSYIQQALRRFCQSADPEPTVRHFPMKHGLDPLLGPWPNNDELAEACLPALRKAWTDVSSPHGRLLKLDFDHYLKAWQLGTPNLPGDFVLFDEAQDANPVMSAIIGAQAGGQVVTVGDPQQQIYEWRGAVNALAQFGGTVTYLTQSFRFGHPIANVANLILGRLESPLRLRGTDTIPSLVTEVPRPRAVLCRSNAAALNVMFDQQAQGRMVHMVGGGREILAFAHAAARLMAGEPAKHPELSCFDTWKQVQEWVDEDPDGASDIAMLVGLIAKYGVDTIVVALESGADEATADVIVSTAHRAKGREWSTVRLASDFPPPQERGDAAAEFRLLYVAATRARDRLDITGCQPVRDLVG